ncbi:hypothetical protein H310_06226 [Aphanomyces invadans]|uniref:Propionyl-CoA synthetase n=1 Tax=Aphanomyces invadans TaxID=157072 RepID=A0A024U7K1_9STRA|nr:hypothetical protein H310_06226 [Aphanomyces invadans]ETW01583.1 hypothetical protein H310_06226 [Aphanomyces invadans]|eukprot:XP_008869431.1 hypothetical protein H310_06226 [Aphanomyces invadans]
MLGRRVSLLRRLVRISSVQRSAFLSTKKNYFEEYDKSLADPEAFWAEAAKDIHWFKPYTTVLDQSNSPFNKWFVDGEMNSCYSAVDEHVANGRGDQVAIHYDSPMTNTKIDITYKELQDKVSRFAGALAAEGVTKGDRVVIYMPMVPETAVAMLACARLGAIHSVVFGGFSSKELAIRIEDASPKVILAASCGLEPKGVIKYESLLKGALSLSSHQPQRCVILQRDQCHYNIDSPRDVCWDAFVQNATPHPCVPVKATDPLYILYTSGTTGKPKGVVRDNGGHNVALKWVFQHVLGLHPGDAWWAASDFGWVVGHSFIVYGPLFLGCTSVIYEGKPVGTPDAGAFWRVVSEYNVRSMFTAPTALRAIRKEDPNALQVEKYASKMKNLRSLFVAGERGDPATIEFFMNELKIPIVDNWWQTEIGFPVCSQMMGMNQTRLDGRECPGIKLGSASRPVPGFDVVLHNHDEPTEDPNEVKEGSILLRLPLPPGCFTTLFNNEAEYVSKYMAENPGFYTTGDAGFIDPDNYVYIMSRTDDIINVAGHRLSTGAIEEVIQRDDNVAECAVVGVADTLKGQVPIALVVLKSNAGESNEHVSAAIVTRVRQEIGAFVCLRHVVVVDHLPKTRSGKIVRRTIQTMADNKPFAIPATIENEAVLDDILVALQSIGYAKHPHHHLEPHQHVANT